MGARQDISVIQPAKCNREISAIRRPDEWIEIEVTVDSGACVTVMPIAVGEHIGILENALSREGFKYEVANGETIKKLGKGDAK